MLKAICATVMVSAFLAADSLQAAEISESRWRPTRDNPLAENEDAEADAGARIASRRVSDSSALARRSTAAAELRRAQFSEAPSGSPIDVDEYDTQYWTPKFRPLRGVQFTGFGEYLLLHPRGSAIDYAVILESPNPDPDFGFPLSPVAQVDPGFHSGFRAGIAMQLDPCCRIEAAFTWFESDDSDRIVSIPAGDATRLQALVVSQRANEDWERGSARSELGFHLVDLNYHCTHCGFDYYAGFRYGQLTQDFHASFVQDPTGFRNGWSGIEFNGWGPRLGVGTERPVACSNWVAYGRFVSSFLAGEFNAEFRQESDDALPNDPPIEINTSADFGRIVPVLELELGVAWEDPRHCFRLSAGYLVSAWFNVVTTDNFVAAVHGQEFDDLDETITFDGLVTRAEVRF